MKSPAKRLIAAGALFLAVAVTAGLLYFNGALKNKDFAPRKMNIILIGVDTLRADHLGSYGYHRNTSENIDSLAGDSFIFTNAVAASSWTKPSMASIMTALYPTVHGAIGPAEMLLEKHHTLAEMLKENGYTTVGVNTNGNISHIWKFDQGFDVYQYPHQFIPAENLVYKGYEGGYSFPSACAVTDCAIQWLKRDREEPFFLFLFYLDPHDPYTINEEFSFGQTYNGPIDGSREKLKEIDQMGAQQAAEVRQYIIDLYDGEIAYTDKHIGRLIDYCKKSGLYNNTLIVLTSDHGEGLWDDGFRAHGSTVSQAQINIPLIIHCPPLAGGKTIKQFTSTINILPTILEATGIEPPDQFQGKSLLPLMLGRREKERLIYSELAYGSRDLDGIILDRLKLVRNRKNNSYELYDLNDGQEKNDLLASQNKSAQKDFQRVLAALTKQQHDNVTLREKLQIGDTVSRTELPDEVRSQLEALGYLQ